MASEPSAVAKTHDEFYVAPIWMYSSEAISIILEQSRTLGFAECSITYQQKEQWFRVVCLEHDVVQVQDSLTRILADLDGEGVSWNEVVDENGTPMLRIDHPWILRLREDPSDSLPPDGDHDDLHAQPAHRSELPPEFRSFNFARIFDYVDEHENEGLTVEIIIPAGAVQEIERSCNVRTSCPGVGRVVYIGGHTKQAVDTAAERLLNLVRISHVPDLKVDHVFYTEDSPDFTDIDARLCRDINPTLLTATILRPVLAKPGLKSGEPGTSPRYETLRSTVGLRVCQHRRTGVLRSLFGPRAAGLFNVQEARRYLQPFSKWIYTPKRPVGTDRSAGGALQVPLIPSLAAPPVSNNDLVQTWMRNLVQTTPDSSSTPSPATWANTSQPAVASATSPRGSGIQTSAPTQSQANQKPWQAPVSLNPGTSAPKPVPQAGPAQPLPAWKTAQTAVAKQQAKGKTHEPTARCSDRPWDRVHEWPALATGIATSLPKPLGVVANSQGPQPPSAARLAPAVISIRPSTKPRLFGPSVESPASASISTQVKLTGHPQPTPDSSQVSLPENFKTDGNSSEPLRLAGATPFAFDMAPLIPNKPSIQKDDDRSTLVFRKTMNQKAPSRQVLTLSDPSPELIEDLSHRVDSLLERLRFMQGQVSLRTVFGRVYLHNFTQDGISTNNKNDDSNGWRPGHLLDRMRVGYPSCDTFMFVDVLSIYGQDAEALYGYPKTAPWKQKSLQVLYEFTCSLDNGESFFVVEVDADSFAVSLRDVDGELCPILVHCLHRHWDLKISATCSPTRKLRDVYAVPVDILVKSLEIPEGTRASPKLFYDEVLINSASAPFVWGVRVRHNVRHVSPDGATFLDLSQVQHMVIKGVDARGGRRRLLAFPGPESPAKGDFAIWFEASLSSAKAEETFKANEGLQLGEEVGWTLESFADGKCFEALWKPALAMVKEMDGVGVLCENGLAVDAPKKKAQIEDPTAVAGFW